MLCIPNAFYSIPEREFRVREVEDPRALCVFRKAPRSEYLGIVASGLTGRAYSGADAITLNNMESKTGSVAFYKQFLFAVARDAINSYLDTDLAIIKQQASDKGLLARLAGEPVVEYKYVIVSLLPIKEHSGTEDCAAKLKEDLAGTYEVEYPLIPGSPKLRFVINKDFVGVTGEGAVCMTRIRKNIDKEDITLIVDIGHVSADIALFEGTTLLGKVKSSTKAGAVLVGEVRAALEDEGYRLTDEQAKRAIETGFVHLGSNKIDVKDIIDEQKLLFVNNFLKKEIIQILNRNDLTAKQVQNFVPIGAPLQEDGPKSMRQAIINSCGLEYATVRDVGVSTRYANIAAASLFTTMLYGKAREMFNSQMQTNE